MTARPTIANLSTAWRALPLLLVGALVFSGAGGLFGATRPPRAAGRPNVVLIVTDDQRWDTLSRMPGVRRVLGDPGVTFENAFVSNSLCCPSRASILTGAYSHTTGVYTNGGRYGFQAFDDDSTVATWLHDAGYRTALVGKYFNGAWPYTFVPPGWDHWATFRGSHSLYFDYDMSIDGRLRSFGSDPSDYSTSVLGGLADRFIRGTDPADPLFLMLTPFAPHSPSTPAPGDRGAVVPGWQPGPNLPERNVSDKPAYIRALDPRSSDRKARERWARQVMTLRAVDEMVLRVAQALRDTGRLDDTLIVFTSDNGFALGEHRWTYKLTPYEESIRVPMVMRYDPITGGETSPALALNVDLAPTIADLAGIEAPGADGRSLMPVLSGETRTVRNAFPIEHAQYREASGRPDPPTYCGVRTQRYTFVHYVTGEEELYDLGRDPFQLRNLASVPAQR
ncbi:MAG: sulfatase family protein, partial [Actinomycetota bacterium]